MERLFYSFIPLSIYIMTRMYVFLYHIDAKFARFENKIKKRSKETYLYFNINITLNTYR